MTFLEKQIHKTKESFQGNSVDFLVQDLKSFQFITKTQIEGGILTYGNQVFPLSKRKDSDFYYCIKFPKFLKAKNKWLDWTKKFSTRNAPSISEVRKLVHKKTSPVQNYSKLHEFKLVTISLASPEKMKKWAEKVLPNGKRFGEVTNANTLHYKTFKPHKGGLFCERIFGPLKDFECACGIYSKPNFMASIDTEKTQRYFCPDCDVEYTWSVIRRYQLGYIQLISPVSHLWYLKANPSYLSILLDFKKSFLETIIYCTESITLENLLKKSEIKIFDTSPKNIYSVWQKFIEEEKKANSKKFQFNSLFSSEPKSKLDFPRNIRSEKDVRYSVPKVQKSNKKFSFLYFINMEQIKGSKKMKKKLFKYITRFKMLQISSLKGNQVLLKPRNILKLFFKYKFSYSYYFQNDFWFLSSSEYFKIIKLNQIFSVSKNLFHSKFLLCRDLKNFSSNSLKKFFFFNTFVSQSFQKNSHSFFFFKNSFKLFYFKKIYSEIFQLKRKWMLADFFGGFIFGAPKKGPQKIQKKTIGHVFGASKGSNDDSIQLMPLSNIDKPIRSFEFQSFYPTTFSSVSFLMFFNIVLFSKLFLKSFTWNLDGYKTSLAGYDQNYVSFFFETSFLESIWKDSLIKNQLFIDFPLRFSSFFVNSYITPLFKTKSDFYYLIGFQFIKKFKKLYSFLNNVSIDIHSIFQKFLSLDFHDFRKNFKIFFFLFQIKKLKNFNDGFSGVANSSFLDGFDFFRAPKNQKPKKISQKQAESIKNRKTTQTSSVFLSSKKFSVLDGLISKVNSELKQKVYFSDLVFESGKEVLLLLVSLNQSLFKEKVFIDQLWKSRKFIQRTEDFRLRKKACLSNSLLAKKFFNLKKVVDVYSWPILNKLGGSIQQGFYVNSTLALWNFDHMFFPETQGFRFNSPSINVGADYRNYLESYVRTSNFSTKDFELNQRFKRENSRINFLPKTFIGNHYSFKLESKNFIKNSLYTISYSSSWSNNRNWKFFLYYNSEYLDMEDKYIDYYKSVYGMGYLKKQLETLTGASFIQKLLKEFQFPLLKKMIQQHQILIPLLNKSIRTFKKFDFKDSKRKKSKERKIEKFFQKKTTIIRRLKLLLKLFHQKTNPNSMILSVLPVLPPDLRPILKLQNQIAASDLNRFYQRILYRNERLKKFLKDPSTSQSFELKYAQRLLQESVDNLIENGKGGGKPETNSRGQILKSLSEILKGKQGRFRQYLLGKRVDYSGRSVIVVGPKLKLSECGLPISIAIELYLPFLIKKILHYKLSKTVIGAKNFIYSNQKFTWNLLTELMKNHPILLNRAPTLHKLGIQAFLPKLIHGQAILLHPLVCTAFNADFDGDQMAVHVPLTIEARTEAWSFLFSRNHLLSAATGEPILLPSQDMVLGCYYLTSENFPELPIKEFQASDHSFSLKSNLILQNFKNFIWRQCFHNSDSVLTAYETNKLSFQAIIWLKWMGKIEGSNEVLVPIEIKINTFGQAHKIHSKLCFSVDSKGSVLSQYIRTTPGRVFMNNIIHHTIR